MEENTNPNSAQSSTTPSVETSVENLAIQKRQMDKSTKVAIACATISLILLISSICCVVGTLGIGSLGLLVDSTIPSGKNSPSKPAKINEKVRTGDIEWEILNAENLGSLLKSKSKYTNDCKASDGTNFIKIKLTATNKGRTQKSVYAPKIVDNQNKEFSPSNSYRISACDIDQTGKALTYESLNPDVSNTYVVYYEIPTTAENLKAKVGGDFSSGTDAKYIDLGLD